VLYVLLAEIQDAMRRYYNVSVSVSVGDLCSSVSGLKDSYESAKTYMAHRLFWGPGSVLDAAKAAARGTQPFRYPSETERNLIEAIRLCNARLVQKEIDAWIARISRAEPTQAVQYTHFLSLAIIRDFETIVEWWDVDAEELYRHMAALDAVETLGDIRRCIGDLCQRIMRIIEENKHQAGALKSLYIVEEIKTFLQQRYADPGLSLDMAANRVGLSAGYVGKLFKSVTGTSFNDYVTQLRMDKAKELLVTRTATIAQIGEMVGICNVPYFTTLFKKTFGMTPSQYRDRYRAGAVTTGE
jgi:YesN/AraC family two-component response regulator